MLAILLSVLASQEALGQRLLCVPVQHGDTAAQLAGRLTGNASDTRQPWFQILDPATARFVSKSKYDHILTGWRACLVNTPIAVTQSRATVAPPLWALRARLLSSLGPLDSNVVLWGLLVAVIAFVSHSGDQYLRQRAMVLAIMRPFAERFVREFERPLIQPGSADRPIQSQVRFAPHRARVEVLLAPNRGRRYPNLADHRNNLEYDVTRVLGNLRNRSFVSGRPYAQGPWVVVPFQLTEDQRAGSR